MLVVSSNLTSTMKTFFLYPVGGWHKQKDPSCEQLSIDQLQRVDHYLPGTAMPPSLLPSVTPTPQPHLHHRVYPPSLQALTMGMLRVMRVSRATSSTPKSMLPGKAIMSSKVNPANEKKIWGKKKEGISGWWRRRFRQRRFQNQRQR